MSDVKIVLRRSPRDHDNGVWVDGVKLQDVQMVDVHGDACGIPTVTIKLVPKTIEIETQGPDVNMDTGINLVQSF